MPQVYPPGSSGRMTFPAGYVPGGDLLAAVDAAHLAGAVVVAAAGNDDARTVAYPAALAGVLSIGSYAYEGSDGDSKRSEFSNEGAALDILGSGGRMDKDKNDDGIPDGLIAQTITPGDPAAFTTGPSRARPGPPPW